MSGKRLVLCKSSHLTRRLSCIIAAQGAAGVREKEIAMKRVAQNFSSGLTNMLVEDDERGSKSDQITSSGFGLVGTDILAGN
ncbi:hypothetical protein E2C01_083161 [Portunus trituberculatus]|uniref:Uncharacterized protein n=1 Tax=Portunus trituberculatus TaxID=210409 RepID=A0A5B7IRR2_PORTR|nr:hypothetical protein [Portunus trituberculatus]